VFSINVSSQLQWRSNAGGIGGDKQEPARLKEADQAPIDRQLPGYNDVRQLVAAHEFGHLLGLRHPGKPVSGNELAPYTADWTSLMGGGNEMRSHYFERWRKDLESDLNTCHVKYNLVSIIQV
jgi:hypothetical protein